MPTATDSNFGVSDEPPRRARVVASATPLRPVADDKGDRPRPGKPKSGKGRKSGGALKPLLIAGGVVALLGLVGVCGGVALLFGGRVLHPAPSGWTTASDSEGRYRVFLPGEVTSREQSYRKAKALGQNVSPPQAPGHSAYDATSNLQVSIESRLMLAGATVPTDPEQLLKLAGDRLAPWDKREMLAAVDIAGRPGAELRAFHNDGWLFDRPPHDFPVPDWLDPIVKKQRQDEAAKKRADYAASQPERDRRAEACRGRAEHKVRYMLATEHRLYVLEVTSTGGYADEGVLAILRDSLVLK